MIHVQASPEASWGGNWAYQSGKGGKDRAIPLPPTLLASLDAWAEQIGGRRACVVRAIQGGHIKAKASRAIPTCVVQAHGEAIGLPNLVPHDLRRAAAQAWWRASHDLVLVGELLGHKSVETTRRYLFVDQAHKVEIVRAVKWGALASPLVKLAGSPRTRYQLLLPYRWSGTESILTR